MDAIQLTEGAAKQINQLVNDAPGETQGLRLNIRPGGCSGHSYHMEYILPEESLDDHEVFAAFDAQLFVPKTHSWMLYGTVIDHKVDELGNARFSFTNPNEAGRCGCGSSFKVSEEVEQSRESVDA